MKIIVIVLFSILLTSQNHFGQTVSIPPNYQIDEKLSKDLYDIIRELDLDLNFDVGEDGIEQISLAVIDLTDDQPKLGGVNYDNFIYPASIYKMYVAAEILNQISQGKYSLYEPYVAKEPNVVDRSKQIDNDPRPLLQYGDTVTINYPVSYTHLRAHETVLDLVCRLLLDKKNKKIKKKNTNLHKSRLCT